MEIDEIKKQMLSYKDLFGNKLLGYSNIETASTKEDLISILEEHESHIEQSANDAIRSLNKFQEKLELSRYS